MSGPKRQYDIDASRSYATKDRLVKAIENFEFDEHRHYIVRNEEGRWTAIFAASNDNPVQFAYAGFLVIG